MVQNVTRHPDRILRAPEVVKLTGRSRVSLWRDEAAGRFPKRVLIGARSVGWRLSEIQTWMDSLSTNEEV